MSDSESDDYNSDNEVLDFSQLWRGPFLLYDTEEDETACTSDTENSCGPGVVLELTPLSSTGAPVPQKIPVEDETSAEDDTLADDESPTEEEEEEVSPYENILQEINSIRTSRMNGELVNMNYINRLNMARQRILNNERAADIREDDIALIRESLGLGSLSLEQESGDFYNQSAVVDEPNSHQFGQLRHRLSNNLRSRWTNPTDLQSQLPAEHISNRVMRMAYNSLGSSRLSNQGLPLRQHSPSIPTRTSSNVYSSIGSPRMSHLGQPLHPNATETSRTSSEGHSRMSHLRYRLRRNLAGTSGPGMTTASHSRLHRQFAFIRKTRLGPSTSQEPFPKDPIVDHSIGPTFKTTMYESEDDESDTDSTNSATIHPEILPNFVMPTIEDIAYVTLELAPLNTSGSEPQNNFDSTSDEESD